MVGLTHSSCRVPSQHGKSGDGKIDFEEFVAILPSSIKVTISLT